MLMANIMSMLKLRNNPGYNGFDLSQKVAYTAKAGELIPCYVQETLPGDKIKLNLDWITRTQPVNTAAFTRIVEHIDAFWIPCNLLWNKFNTFVTQMSNNAQHAFNLLNPASVDDQLPYISLQDLLTYLRNMSENNTTQVSGGYEAKYLDINNQPRFVQTLKLLTYLGYGDFIVKAASDLSIGSKLPDLVLNPFRLLAYQKIYADFYRNSQWENADPTTFNVDYAGNYSFGQEQSSSQIPIELLTTSADRMNEDSMFTLRYADFRKDLLTGLLPSSQYGDVAMVNVSDDSSGLLYAPLGFKIESQISSPSSGDTSVVPGLVIRDGNSVVPGSRNTLNYVISQDDGSSTFTSHVASPYATVDMSKFTSALSVLALRRAEALQRWKEITQSNQQDYKHQVEAHFGHEVSDSLSEHVKWLGGIENTVNISEVVNTNLSAGEDNISTNTATISGKGIGQGKGNIDFTAPTHGIIMCIYYAEPVLDYATNGIDAYNLKSSAADFAIPEFDRVGMVPVPACRFVVPVDSRVQSIDQDALSSPLGYAPCYIDYKTAVDVVRGGFAVDSFANWVAPITSDYLVRRLYPNTVSAGQKPNVTYALMKIPASMLDSIFVTNASPAGPDVQSSDSSYIEKYYSNSMDCEQLLINCMVDAKFLRKLDRNGLPY